MNRVSGLFLLLFFAASCVCAAAEKSIAAFGEYPVVEELGEGAFQQEDKGGFSQLIEYGKLGGYKQKAFREALHFLDANVFGYTFIYKPGSVLMKTEEVFDVELRGSVGEENTNTVGEGVNGNIYRVKLDFSTTPSVQRWHQAFVSNTIRLMQSEGTSEFYTGWEGRSDALREALRNLVLAAAMRGLSSKPLLLKGDILLKGNPEFSVGAGRHYCKISGYVNFVEIITYD
jgi:hypothetical protein